jgi:hypothetical protein
LNRRFLNETQGCDQQIINIATGAWIGSTVLLNLVLAVYIAQKPRLTESDNSLLCEDSNSPVGYRVPNFPDFIVDPSNAKRGLSFISLENEMYLSLFVALLMMAAIVSMPYTGWNTALQDYISDALQGQPSS